MLLPQQSLNHDNRHGHSQVGLIPGIVFMLLLQFGAKILQELVVFNDDVPAKAFISRSVFWSSDPPQKVLMGDVVLLVHIQATPSEII